MSVPEVSVINDASLSNVPGGWSQPNTTYPAGLEYLMGLNYLFVNQKIELLEGELCLGLCRSTRTKIKRSSLFACALVVACSMTVIV